MKDRNTKGPTAKVVERADKPTLQGCVLDRTKDDAIGYTDETRAYIGLPRNHGAVNHSVREYVNEMASTNGLDSHWAMMKRGLHGTYHQVSPKHAQRYVDEFSGRHNQRPMDTADQMVKMAQSGVAKQL